MQTTTDATEGRVRPTIVVERRWAVSAGLAAIALLAALIVAVSVALDRGPGGPEGFPAGPGSAAMGMTPPSGAAVPGHEGSEQMPQMPEQGALPEGAAPPAQPPGAEMPAPEDGAMAAPGSGVAPEAAEGSTQGSDEPLTPESLRQPDAGASGQPSPAG